MSVKRAALIVGTGVVAGWLLALLGVYVTLMFVDHPNPYMPHP